MIRIRPLIPLGFGLLGIVFAHHPMLLTGFRGVQIDHEDPRLINYLLEHGYLWLRGAAGHQQIWNPPFFYPAPNGLAYSDTLLSAGPLYWPFRLAGLPPDTSFQAWLMTCFLLNYGVFLFWLLRFWRLDPVAASLGAFLFAFGAPRVADIGHPQLLTQFFSILALMSLGWLLESQVPSFAWRFVAWTGVQLGLVAQFYASFYVGLFHVLALGVAATIAITSPASRIGLVRVLRRDLPVIGVSLLLPLLLIRPLMVHYLEVAALAGYRSWFEVSLGVPLLPSWVYSGPESWLYGWMPRLNAFMRYGALEPAHRIGIGLVTPLVCLAGLWSGRSKPVTRLLAATGLSLFVLTTPIPRDLLVAACLALWPLCSGPLLDSRATPVAKACAAAVTGILCWVFFPAATLGLVVLIAAVGIGGGLAAPNRRRSFHLGSLSVVFAFLVITAFPDRPLLGAVATSAAVGCLWRSDRLAGSPHLGLLLVALLVFLALSPGSLEVWRFIHRYVPAAGAIRVTSRVIVVLLIPLSLGFALFWQKLASGKTATLAFPLALFCLLEQGITTTTHDKDFARMRVRRIAREVAVSRDVEAFYWSASGASAGWNDHLDAMWAGLIVGTPTVNGYSGNSPPGWRGLDINSIRGPNDEDRLRQALLHWCSLTGLRPPRLAWIVQTRRLPVSDPAQSSPPGKAAEPGEH